jgi:histidine triad (HIT) family protein
MMTGTTWLPGVEGLSRRDRDGTRTGTGMACPPGWKSFPVITETAPAPEPGWAAPHRDGELEGGFVYVADCLFCRIAGGEIPADVIHSDPEVMAFRDIHPQAPTHVLIIPRKHIPSVNELSRSEADLMGRLFLVARDLARKEGVGEGGYRMVVNAGPDAGQSVFHVHMHLLGGRALGWPPG